MVPAKGARKPGRRTTASGRQPRRNAPRKTARAQRASASQGGRRAPGKAASASAAQLKAVPTLVPHLIVDGCAEAMAWYAKVFGAKEMMRQPMPNGRIMHAAMQMGNTKFMLGDSFGPAPEKMAGVVLHVNTPSGKAASALWDKAMAAGARPMFPIADQFWGERYGQLRDPWGQIWGVSGPIQLSKADAQRLEREAMAMMASGKPEGFDASA